MLVSSSAPWSPPKIGFLMSTSLSSFGACFNTYSLNISDDHLRDSESRLKVWMSATSSVRSRRGAGSSSVCVCFESKRIFRAVPSPLICSFPHSLQRSHATQSRITEMFRKWFLNCALRAMASLPWNMVFSSNVSGHVCVV